MLGLRESCRNHNVVYRRTNHAGQLGHRTKFPLPACPACSDYPNGCRWPVESRYCSQTQDFSAHRPTVATTLLSASAFWPGKGCPSPWPYSTNLSAQDHCCYPGYFVHNSGQRNALEYAQHGQDSRSQRGHHSPNLEATQPETSFDRNLQTQPRQAIHREAPRCRGPLPQSSRQSLGSVRRREKSDSSPRSHSTSVTFKTRNPSTANPRLQTQRNHHSVRSPQHARRQSHWRLYASPPTSGIYSLPPTHQCSDTCRSGFTLDRRQLWHPQTSPRPILAETSPTISSAFHPHIQFLAQYGGTVVSRDHGQTDSPRFIQKCPLPGGSHKAVHRNTQSKSKSFHLDRFR